MNRRNFFKSVIGAAAGIAVLPRLVKHTEPSSGTSSHPSISSSISTSTATSGGVCVPDGFVEQFSTNFEKLSQQKQSRIKDLQISIFRSEYEQEGHSGI